MNDRRVIRGSGVQNWPMSTAAVILSAGAARRFGSPKQLAPIGERTMLEVVCDAARGAGLAPLIVVAPTSLPIPDDAHRVPNDDPGAGMSVSLRLGFGAVPAEADAAVILLADQPTISAATIRRLVTADREGRAVVASMYGDVIGPPVLLERAAFDLVTQAAGDEGLRTTLASRSELVTPFVLGQAPVDVDTPAELAEEIELCPGCGAVYRSAPQEETHPYIGASPACWAAFSQLIAREFSDPSVGAMHRHTVDIYAAQHPGVDGRRQRQSVAVHLISICAWLERGLDPDRLLPVTRHLTDEKRQWPWLDPPAACELTVLDVQGAVDGVAYQALVQAWGRDVWEAWAPHHDRVRAWTDAALRS